MPHLPLPHTAVSLPARHPEARSQVHRGEQPLQEEQTLYALPPEYH